MHVLSNADRHERLLMRQRGAGFRPLAATFSFTFGPGTFTDAIRPSAPARTASAPAATGPSGTQATAETKSSTTQRANGDESDWIAPSKKRRKVGADQDTTARPHYRGVLPEAQVQAHVQAEVKKPKRTVPEHRPKSGTTQARSSTLSSYDALSTSRPDGSVTIPPKLLSRNTACRMQQLPAVLEQQQQQQEQPKQRKQRKQKQQLVQKPQQRQARFVTQARPLHERNPNAVSKPSKISPTCSNLYLAPVSAPSPKETPSSLATTMHKPEHSASRPASISRPVSPPVSRSVSPSPPTSHTNPLGAATLEHLRAPFVDAINETLEELATLRAARPIQAVVQKRGLRSKQKQKERSKQRRKQGEVDEEKVEGEPGVEDEAVLAFGCAVRTTLEELFLALKRRDAVEWAFEGRRKRGRRQR